MYFFLFLLLPNLIFSLSKSFVFHPEVTLSNLWPKSTWADLTYCAFKI